MYTPSALAMTEKDDIAAFIHHFGFALLVTPDLDATHLPLFLDREQSPMGMLYGHLSRANPQAHTLDGQRVLAIFSGPHSYISPTWYASAPAVPTWNYAAVHCYGQVELLSEAETTRSMDTLVTQYEPALLSDDAVAQALMPSAFKQKLQQGVVGFRILLDQIQGKEKLGQQRPDADQQGVYQALQQSDRHDERALAAYMKQRQLGTGAR
ncbi:transcriptional regulator [Terasakiispira papahanaumokuakeensis]|uniref:Transcriptional regulator n=1 Tax=Terasakiispira papahanaumokuakeensis TaxID=197479 RepID=A0A1E2V7B9_9GAMM|nr:FMN-binding negative transcriptional regulator [Terasakiispira papahanaumokuakeensis]ODC02910.1 transcriptional regulator [Terasakiispira papahanaumokuakeensis]